MTQRQVQFLQGWQDVMEKVICLYFPRFKKLSTVDIVWIRHSILRDSQEMNECVVLTEKNLLLNLAYEEP